MRVGAISREAKLVKQIVIQTGNSACNMRTYILLLV